MRRLSTLSFLFVATACVGIREDPRDTQPASVLEITGSGGSGGSGGTGATGGTGGTGGIGGAPAALTQCECGINFLGELSVECDQCFSDQVLGNQLECDDVKVACENDTLGCALAAGLVAPCEVVDENCLNNLATLNSASLALLDDYFACVCSPSVCLAACDPGGPALSCVPTQM